MSADKIDQAGALPIKKYAVVYGVRPSTVWRAVRDGRLQYVVVGRRKLILQPRERNANGRLAKTDHKRLGVPETRNLIRGRNHLWYPLESILAGLKCFPGARQ
jgi:hypothetical protein